MGNPLLGVNSVLAFIKEDPAAAREAIVGGDTSNEFLDVVSESLDYVPVLFRPHPIVGTRQPNSDFQSVGHNDGGGAFTIRPRHGHAATLIECIIGPIDTGVYHPVADGTDLVQYTLECLKAGTSEVVLVGCKTNTATFRSSSNEPLTIEINTVALSGERDPGDLTAGNIVTLAAEKPFMHGGVSMSCAAEAWLGGATPEPIRSLEFTINNNLGVDEYCNSANRAIIPVGIFELTGIMEIPYNATTKGFWTEMINAAKVKFTITYTDADANTIAVAFVVKLDGELPKIAGPENQWVSINFHGVVDATDTQCIGFTIST